MSELPTGTVTFFFSDIEGSTRLLERLGPEYTELLERHNRIVRSAFAQHGGLEVSTEGDSFFAVFQSATEAVTAAVDMQRRIGAESWPQNSELRIQRCSGSAPPRSGTQDVLAGVGVLGLGAARQGHHALPLASGDLDGSTVPLRCGATAQVEQPADHEADDRPPSSPAAW